MSSVTVFVLPQDFAAQELLDTYERWVREGLVGEAAFVLPEFVDDSHSGPPLVSAEIIGPERGQLSETSSVGAIDVLRERKNLFVYLNSRRRDRVRVVVAQLLTFDSHTRDPEFARKAESVANQVVRAMPTSTVAGGHSTRVQRFNVLIPVSGLTGVSPDALFLGWDVNAIVSAEDHPDADHGNMRVHYPGNAVGHALTALATIGGVVSGIDAGPFDDYDIGQSTSNGREIVLLRPSVRGVIGTDAGTNLAIQTLDAVNASPLGVIGYTQELVAPHNAELLISNVLGYLKNTPPWSPAPEQSVAWPQTNQDSIQHGFAEALKYDLAMFGTVPRWAVSSATAALENTATEAIVGGGADTVLRLRPLSAEEADSAATASITSDHQRATRIMIERSGMAPKVPPVTTWPDLRSVIFAAADGGALPESLPTPRYGHNREVLLPAMIVPGPDDVYTIPADIADSSSDEIVLPWDLVGHNSGLEHYDAAELDVAEQLATVMSLKAALPADAEARFDTLHKSKTLYLRWLDQIYSTVLGGLLRDESQRARQLREEYERGREIQAAGVPSNDSLVAARTLLLNRWLRTILTFTLLGLGLLALVSNAQSFMWGNSYGDLAHLVRSITRSESVLSYVLSWTWVRWIIGLTLAALAATYVFHAIAKRKRTSVLAQNGQSGSETDQQTEIDSINRTRLQQNRWTRIVWVLGIALVLALTLPSWGWMSDHESAFGDLVSRVLGIVATFLTWVYAHWPWGIVLLVLGLFLTLFWWNHCYYKASREYFHQVEKSMASYRRRIERTIYCGEEASRLEQLITILQDWIAIISYTLHRPYGDVQKLSRDVDDTIIETVPASFAVARAVDEKAVPKRLIAQAVRVLYPVGDADRSGGRVAGSTSSGWAARAFANSYTEFARESTYEDQEGVLAVDLDGAAHGPRTELLEYWKSGQASDYLTGRGVEALRGEIREGRLVLAVRDVRRIGQFGATGAMPEPDFFEPPGRPRHYSPTKCSPIAVWAASKP